MSRVKGAGGPVVVAGPGLKSQGSESTLEVAVNGVAWTEAGEVWVGDRGLGTTGISERRDLSQGALAGRLRGHSTHGSTRRSPVSERRRGVTPADLKPTGAPEVSGQAGWAWGPVSTKVEEEGVGVRVMSRCQRVRQGGRLSRSSDIPGGSGLGQE